MLLKQPILSWNPYLTCACVSTGPSRSGFHQGSRPPSSKSKRSHEQNIQSETSIACTQALHILSYLWRRKTKPPHPETKPKRKKTLNTRVQRKEAERRVKFLLLPTIFSNLAFEERNRQDSPWHVTGVESHNCPGHSIQPPACTAADKKQLV